MIEAAVILSGVLRHWPDFFIILVLLVANGVVGFWEEHQAGKAIDALKAELAIKARTIRDGKWIMHHRVSWCRATSFASALGTSFRQMRGCWTEIGRGGPVRPHRESLPATRKSARQCSPLRSFDRVRSAPRVCHGCEHLLRQDGARARSANRQPLPTRGVEDRTFLIILAVLLVSVITIV